MSSTPWNIAGSASQLFYRDKQPSKYTALLTISSLPHPERSILGTYFDDAVDPEEAARYFVHVTSAQEGSQVPEKTVPQFLPERKTLVDRREQASTYQRSLLR